MGIGSSVLWWLACPVGLFTLVLVLVGCQSKVTLGSGVSSRSGV